MLSDRSTLITRIMGRKTVEYTEEQKEESIKEFGLIMHNILDCITTEAAENKIVSLLEANLSCFRHKSKPSKISSSNACLTVKCLNLCLLIRQLMTSSQCLISSRSMLT